MPDPEEKHVNVPPLRAAGADWRRQLRISRPIQRLLIIGVIGVACIAALTALVILELRAKEIADAERELLTLNVSLAEQTERSIQSVDLILSSVVEELRADGVNNAADYMRLRSGRSTHELLLAKISGVPQLGGLVLVAADGAVINVSHDFPFNPTNVSDRDYFAALKDTVTDRPFLSEPVQNRGTGAWTIFLARRVNGPAGEFIGLVLGAMSLDYYQDLYKALQTGEGSAIALWRDDGVLLARYPPFNGVGRTFALQTFVDREGGEAKVYEISHSIDGIERIIARRALRGYPVIVNVTRTKATVLADWRQQALAIGGVGSVCAAALILMLWAFARQFRSYEALAEALAQREEAVRGRKQAEAQLGQLQKMEAVGQLTGGIAHDFNNILTVVIGNLDTLSRGLPLGSTFGNAARAALHGAERAAILTQRLLAFARRQPLEPKLVDLNKLVSSMSDLLRRTLSETIAIETVFAGGLWRVHADPNQLESVLLNLVINARDAMPRGGRITIETGNVYLDEEYADAQGDLIPGAYAMLAVSDSGAGMSEEVIGKAFEPFFTTKEVGKGTGLGLSQVYGFMKQSGGHAKIYSEIGQGTTVKLYLPRFGIDEIKDEREIDAGAVIGKPQHERIMVVEDDEDVRDYAVSTLRTLGYAVIEAGNGPAALRMIETQPDIRLLFTDVGLPGGVNGRQLADEVRRRYPAIKVLFTTGYARNAIVHGGRLDGDVELITKPFTHATLAAKVRRMLEEK